MNGKARIFSQHFSDELWDKPARSPHGFHRVFLRRHMDLSGDGRKDRGELVAKGLLSISHSVQIGRLHERFQGGSEVGK